jgi:ABC-type nitrate/sulfonate/bicarbonate transport system substrate-binding protein
VGNEQFVKDNPDLTKRFLAATQKSYQWARDHITEAAQLHKKLNPETDVDDTIGTLKMQFQYMFNETTDRDGFGYFNRKQLQETYNVVSEAQHLPTGTDINQFVDTSFLPTKAP